MDFLKLNLFLKVLLIAAVNYNYLSVDFLEFSMWITLSSVHMNNTCLVLSIFTIFFPPSCAVLSKSSSIVWQITGRSSAFQLSFNYLVILQIFLEETLYWIKEVFSMLRFSFWFKITNR